MDFTVTFQYPPSLSSSPLAERTMIFLGNWSTSENGMCIWCLANVFLCISAKKMREWFPGLFFKFIKTHDSHETLEALVNGVNLTLSIFISRRGIGTEHL